MGDAEALQAASNRLVVDPVTSANPLLRGQHGITVEDRHGFRVVLAPSAGRLERRSTERIGRLLDAGSALALVEGAAAVARVASRSVPSAGPEDPAAQVVLADREDLGDPFL